MIEYLKYQIYSVVDLVYIDCKACQTFIWLCWSCWVWMKIDIASSILQFLLVYTIYSKIA